jgi:hypothetical protein
MEKVKIKKAKIKDGLFLDVEFTEDLPGHSKKDTKLSCTVPVHEDLLKAFEKLPKHLAILTDALAKPSKVKKLEEWEDEELTKFAVKGFSIGGNDENEGVTLSGSKKGEYGLINLNTPFQKWEASDYKHIGDLGSDINDCIYEVEQYLFEGKKAPESQLSLFDDVTVTIEGGEEI